MLYRTLKNAAAGDLRAYSNFVDLLFHLRSEKVPDDVNLLDVSIGLAATHFRLRPSRGLSNQGGKIRSLYPQELNDKYTLGEVIGTGI